MSDDEPNYTRRKILAGAAVVGVLGAAGVAAGELTGGMNDEQQRAYDILWDPKTKTKIYAVNDTEEIRQNKGATIRNKPDANDDESKRLGKLVAGKIFKGVPWDGRDPHFPERYAPNTWVAARLKNEKDGTEIIGFVAQNLLHEIPSK
jgi:hypothetical protein